MTPASFSENDVSLFDIYDSSYLTCVFKNSFPNLGWTRSSKEMFLRKPDLENIRSGSVERSSKSPLDGRRKEVLHGL